MKILIAEDIQEIRELWADLLDEFNFTLAKDGAEAWAIFNSSFDLILTDLNMPNMNGLKLIKNIRQVDSEIPIIMFTASSDLINDDLMKMMNITKVFDKTKLKEVLKFIEEMSRAL